MSFGLSISLFFIIGVFYIVIVEFYTMMFRITGLTREKARFQVISLLTNSGYSTEESELVVKVLPRRRIARTIMLFGYVFSITIVSVFVNAMMALPNSEKEEVWIPLLVVCILFVIFMLVRRIPVVREAYNTLLEELGRKWLHNDDGNPILLQEEFPKGVIAAATLNKMPADINGRTLRELQLPEKYGLQIVYVRRDDAVLVNLPSDMKFQERDEVVVYGPMKNIRSIFAYEPAAQQDDLKEASRPVSASEFIHDQDVKNARRAAHAERAREKQAAARPASGGPEPKKQKPVSGGPESKEQKPASGTAESEEQKPVPGEPEPKDQKLQKAQPNQVPEPDRAAPQTMSAGPAGKAAPSPARDAASGSAGSGPAPDADAAGQTGKGSS
ncbi:MAG: hypothetical protein HDQ87_04345 [Clostridia bacterium]|nr:hypothetical protein [Clostridia bacterium]